MRGFILGLCLSLTMLVGCQTLLVVDRNAKPVAGAEVTMVQFSLGPARRLGVTNRKGRLTFRSFRIPAVESLFASKDGVGGYVWGQADPLLIILPMGEPPRRPEGPVIEIPAR